ncbi:SETMR methyltransferase, partial [Polypterus senegalus]
MARGDFKTDVTCGLENLPVFVDTGGASGGDGWRKFKYSPENVSGPGAALDPSEITFPGCDCLSSSCQLDSCLCLQRHGSAYTDDLRLTSSATRQEAGFSKPLFECNIMCKCGDSCKNRVVQRGLAYRFEVFETELKGCGLRTLELIPQGSFVCEYAGEVLSSAEAHGDYGVRVLAI